MKRLLTCILLSAVCLIAPAAAARDTIEASPYGMILDDLLGAFYADVVPCDDGSTGNAEVCFRAETVGASYLAERLTEVVAGYGSAGLRSDGWRSANGVWTVNLAFVNERHGRLEVYLAEAPDNCVRGVVRLVAP